MFVLSSKNREKFKIILVCFLISIGIGSSFEFNGSYAIDNAHRIKQVSLSQNKNDSNQSKIMNDRTSISAHVLPNAPHSSNIIFQNCTPTSSTQATLTINKIVANPSHIITVPDLNTLQFGVTVINNRNMLTSNTLTSGSTLLLRNGDSVRLCISPGSLIVTETNTPSNFNFVTSFASAGTTPIRTTGSSCIASNILAGENVTCAITNTLVTGPTTSTSVLTSPTIIAPADQTIINPQGIISAQGIINSQGQPLCKGGLPCGRWTIMANGLVGSLIIPSVDNQGKIINGSLLGHVISNGSWDHISKKIKFTEIIGMGFNNSTTYQYTGFYHNICGIGMATTLPFCFILAGSAVPKGLPPQETAREEFGWIALYIPFII